jgi:hypothetical protein
MTLKVQKVSILVLLFLIVANVASFTVIPNRIIFSVAVAPRHRDNYCRLFLSEDTPTPESSDAVPPPQSAASFVPGAQTQVVGSESTTLSIPSPILLGGSMVLGIAATGKCVHVCMYVWKPNTNNHENKEFWAVSKIVSVIVPNICLFVTGSIFELSGGDPKIGFGATLAIAVLGLPGCIFLFLEAIKKATEETEEDDRKFRGE